MVKLNKIYTRTGDKGTTGLGTGDRVAKHHPRIAAYGTVDEVNAIVGLVRLHTKDSVSLTGSSAKVESAALDEMLARVQNDLFDLGADLCVPEPQGDAEPPAFEPLRITPAQVTWLEARIDDLNGELEPLKSFILPGGSPAAAHLHLARTVSRRAERLMVELSLLEGETVSEAALKYINRLSDFLFVIGRYVNDLGKEDVLWVPGKNR